MEGLSQLPKTVQREGGAGTNNANGGAEDEAKKAQDEQMRRDLLATVLDTAARERLSRISLVSPERSRQIEGILIRMTQTGQMRGRMTEAQLIDLLEQMEGLNKASSKKSNIVFQRRKDLDDDDDW